MQDMSNMSPAAMAAWERLLKTSGLDLSINSAYRDPAHNAKVGGAKKSQHMHGNAFDVNVRDMDRAQRNALISQARDSGFQGIGVYNNALHFDVGPSRSWGSDYTGASLPDWAREAVGAPVGQHANALAGSGGSDVAYGGAGNDQTQGEEIPVGKFDQAQLEQIKQMMAAQQPRPPSYKTNTLNAQDFAAPTAPMQLRGFS